VEFRLAARRRGPSIPAVGYEGLDNEAANLKTRRPTCPAIAQKATAEGFLRKRPSGVVAPQSKPHEDDSSLSRPMIGTTCHPAFASKTASPIILKTRPSQIGNTKDVQARELLNVRHESTSSVMPHAPVVEPDRGQCGKSSQSPEFLGVAVGRCRQFPPHASDLRTRRYLPPCKGLS